MARRGAWRRRLSPIYSEKWQELWAIKVVVAIRDGDNNKEAKRQREGRNCDWNYAQVNAINALTERSKENAAGFIAFADELSLINLQLL
jgi:hypothetical protein